jgi:Flp pilus assembly protein TadG
MTSRGLHAFNHRHGNVLVLTAFLMIVMVAFLALGIDIGYLQNARVELQASADAAAMAATWELVDDGSLAGLADLSDDILAARDIAIEFAGLNKVCSLAPSVDLNAANAHSGDIVVGYLASGAAPDAPLDTSDPNKFNAVQIRVRRTSDQNGKVPMFFARALGLDSVAAEATATAMLQRNICGFRTPAEGDPLAVLPFAMDKQAWDNLVNNGAGADEWHWDGTGKQVTPYCDGIKEINLYPEGVGLQAARGAVEIGASGSNAADLGRRIAEGISRNDVLDLGTALELDSSGRLYLNGTSGISESVNAELASLVGKTRIIPVFDAAGSVGDSVTYTVVQWAGVRVMDVDVSSTSSNKRVIVQPANVVTRYAKSKEGTQSSWFVYSPAWLVR